MINVNSKEAIRLTASRFMRANRRRNLIVVFAVIMTALMFTSLFTAAVSVIKSTQAQEIRLAMNTSHIAATGLTEEKFEQMKGFADIDSYGYVIRMSSVENTAVGNADAQIACADEAGARAVCSLPEVGRMPEKDDEAAMSTIILDLLGVPHEIGSTVSLEYSADGKTQKKDFVLSGYWKGDPIAPQQMVWLSERFCRAHVEAVGPKEEGIFDLYLWFESPLRLQEELRQMETAYGVSASGASLAVNSAFDYFGEDGVRIDLLLLLALIIFTAGYLIIFSVFRISVNEDLRVYGLLKTIGMTAGQLKRVVWRQALHLSALGIPLGLLCGFFTGKLMTPYLLASDSVVAPSAEAVNSAHPLIFIVSALLALLTVYVGCHLPMRIAGRISPVEAMKLNLDSGVQRRKTKRTGGTGPLSMAASNLRRSWKRTALVILSLALPVTLLNASYSISKSYDYEQFLDAYNSFDFVVSGLTQDRSTSFVNAVKPEVAEDIAGREEAEKTALVYNSDVSHRLNETGARHLKEILHTAEEQKYLEDYELEREKKSLEKRQVSSHVMGINEAAFEKLQLTAGDADYARFAEGDYIIVSDLVQGFGTYYDPGDRVRISLGNGKSREFTVLAVGFMPYDLSYRFGLIQTLFDPTFYLPVSAYQELGGSEDAMLIGVDVKNGQETEFADWLEGRIEDAQPSLYVESRLALLNECKRFSQKYYMITGMVSAVLFVIGLMNFFNTSQVNLLARRRELALLSAVGMTRRQTRLMLAAEGAVCAIAAVLLADTLGMAVCSPLIENTVGLAFYFDYQMSVLPSLLLLPLLLAAAIWIPAAYYHRMGKKTIIQVLRTE